MSELRKDSLSISLKDISLSFGGLQVLKGLDIEVRRGEVCSLIGPNGAGKSSLLNILNGIYRADSGVIVLDGENRLRWTPHKAARAGIGRTFQNLALFKNMSVLDNVLAGQALGVKATWLEYLLGLPRAWREQAALRLEAQRIIDFLHLQPFRHTTVGKLPYGLQKRVELARALASKPRLLLLDEPMAGMNAEEKQEMVGFIHDVNQEFGTTIVIIEHDIGVVMDISDHVIVLDYGKKIGDGSPEEVRNNKDVMAAYLGAPTRHRHDEQREAGVAA